jgi:hypothetical protein
MKKMNGEAACGDRAGDDVRDDDADLDEFQKSVLLFR